MGQLMAHEAKVDEPGSWRSGDVPCEIQSTGSIDRGAVNLFRNLTITLNQQTLLDNQSLSVDAGAITVITGLSGSGKSVLADAAFGLHDPSSQIQVKGYCGHLLTEGALVFQAGSGIPHLTVKDNLRLVCSDEAQCDRVATSFGLPIDRLASHLSGGERQRLAVARCVLAGRAVWWLDEPDAGLDVYRMRELATTLRDERAKGVAIVVVTHNLEFAAEIADRCFFLVDGTLAEQPCENIRSDWSTLYATTAPVHAVGPAPIAVGGTIAVVGRLQELYASGSATDWLAHIVRSICAMPLCFANSQSRATALHALRLVAVRGCFYYPVIGAIFGGVFVAAFGTIQFISAERIISDYGPQIVLRFSPVIGALLVAASGGSTISAWVGHMTASRQLDALSVLGVDVQRRLLAAVWWGFAVGATISIAAFGLAITLVFNASTTDREFWNNFFRAGGSGPSVPEALVECVGYATAIGGITIGSAARMHLRSASDVAAAVTRGIVWSSVLVMLLKLAILWMS